MLLPPSPSNVYPPEVLSVSELAEKARIELNETEETRAQGLVDLKELIKEEIKKFTANSDGSTNIMYARRNDDAFLLRFLRARKFNAESAFSNLKHYEEFRARHTEMFDGDGLLDNVKHIFEEGAVGILPKRHPSGAVILVIYAGRMNFKDFNMERQMQVSMGLTILVYALSSSSSSYDYDCITSLILSLFVQATVYSSEILMQSVETQVCGVMMVEDLSGFSLREAMRLKPSDSRVSFEWMQECMPARLKGIHCINPPWYIRALFMIVHPFMKKKMKERVFVYGADLTLLYKRVCVDVLPHEFGGLIEFDPQAWVRQQLQLEHEQQPPQRQN